MVSTIPTAPPPALPPPSPPGAIRCSQRPFLILLALALVLPSLLFGGLAWREHDTLLHEGEQVSKRTSNALTEHALKVLETHALVLEQIDSQIRDRSWEEIVQDARVQHSLTAVARKFPQIESIWLADAQGRLRQASGGVPAGPDVTVADRDYFAAHRDGPQGRLFISSPFDGRLSGMRLFTVSMRRTTSDGRFDGVISVAVALDYFTRFWQQFAPSTAHVIPLIREDGTMLVRYPAGEHPPRLAPSAPFLQQIAKAPEGGFYVAQSKVDGIERMNAYSRIGGYPLYVSFSLETQAVLAPWRARLLLYAALALVTTFALATVVLMAMRHARDQRLAAASWQEAAQRYEAEIRRREQAEAELLQAQKMEAVGQLTGGVAHDFNNLLHAMGLNLRLAERTVGDGPASRFLENVRRGIERAAQLTRQLTAFSRRQPLEPTTFAPESLVVRMADLLARTLGGKIQLEIDTDRDVWPVFADPGQTELALLNLAVNARDAMPDGGRLVIRARNLSVPDPGRHGLAAGQYVELAVVDTGCGMPPEVLKRAFEPFFTTKEIGKGTGLGLSMVHGFALQSGGGVTIDSRLGQGTTVCLLLPCGKPEALADEARRETGAETSRLGGRILLVEDDSLVRASMLLALREAGYQVDEARSGAEALDALRRASLDLLVTDYAMPGMTGTELARLARALQPGLPIVLVTGYAQQAMETEPGHQHQLDAVLHKPFAPHELVARIEGLLWRQREPGTKVAAG